MYYAFLKTDCKKAKGSWDPWPVPIQEPLEIPWQIVLHSPLSAEHPLPAGKQTPQADSCLISSYQLISCLASLRRTLHGKLMETSVVLALAL